MGLSHQCRRIASVIMVSANYYGHFVRHFVDIADPFCALLYKEFPWHWNDTEESAMLSLCTALCSHPVLALPDFTKPFRIESAASDTTVGGVLTQEHASVHKPIAFLSKTLTSSEWNYSVHDWWAACNCYLLQSLAPLHWWAMNCSPHWSQTSHSLLHLTFTQ